MLWFKKKKRVYPFGYSEWLKEFKRIEEEGFHISDAEMLAAGELENPTHAIGYFKQALVSFLETQLNVFFEAFKRTIERPVEEGNGEYMLLVVRRFHEEYKKFYFFENYEFLPLKYRQDIKSELEKKLAECESDLARYLDKLAVYSDSMSYVALNIKRLTNVNESV